MRRTSIFVPTLSVFIIAGAISSASGFVRSETTVTYKDFKFFTVEVEIK